MKKILLVTDNAYAYSGREKIFSFMNFIYSKKNLVTVVSLNGYGVPAYNYDNCSNFITLDQKKGKLIKLLSIINRNDFDYVFIVSMGKLSTIFSAYINFIRNKNTKVIACEHVSLKSLGTVKENLKKFALKNYNSIIVLTEKDKFNLEKSGLKNVFCIKNPIQTFHCSEKKFDKKAIAVGRLERQKNFEDLIYIWNEFIKNNYGWKLYIYGDGSEKGKLTGLIDSLRLNESIILAGRIADTQEIYNNASICLMTSIYEGLPLVLLEAKSNNIPCISYNCPTGPEEIIKNNYDGYLIELYDRDSFVKKMNELIRDDGKLSLFSKRCSESLEEYNMEKIILDWESIIK